MKKALTILPLLMTLTPFGFASDEIDFRGVPYKSVETIRVLRAKNKSLVEQCEALELQAAIELSLCDQTHEGTVRDLKETVAKITTDRNKETATKRALQRDLAALEQEQVDTRDLLDSLLKELPSVVTQVSGPLIPSSALPSNEPSTQPTRDPSHQGVLLAPTLSRFQQDLLPLWTAGKIGPKAWDALGGSNANLASVLKGSICGYPGKNVELSNLEIRSFTLRVNQKEHDRIYKFIK